MAASEAVERAGNERYHDDHMGAIFTEGFSFSGYERDLLAMNDGKGRFLDISGVSGIDSISDGRGSTLADLDNDGDLDIFLTTAQREAHFLFRNDIGSRNGFVRIALTGTTRGRDAYGTVVRLKSSAGIQTKLVAGGSGFLSQHDPRLLFGLGQDREAEWIEIVWPSGSTQRFERVPTGATIRVVEGETGYAAIEERRFALADPLPADRAFLARLGIRRGEPFPAVSLRTPSGEARRLRDLGRTGRRLLVNLWATWCVPCAQEMPELQRLYADLERNGVDLVGVSVDLSTAGEVAGYVAERRISYPIFITDEAAMEQIYPSGEATVPLTVLLDEEGTVLEIYSGWNARSERALGALARGVSR